MQKEHAEKIELALKSLIVFLFSILTILLLLIFLPFKQDILTLQNQRFTLAVASSTTAQAEGLGGRAFLPAKEGMLFVFKTAGFQCFWMKDTLIPLDIIWINSDKKVLFIQPNVSPLTFPHIYCPSVLARYVIELNAGTTSKYHIVPGITLQF